MKSDRWIGARRPMTSSKRQKLTPIMTSSTLNKIQNLTIFLIETTRPPASLEGLNSSLPQSARPWELWLCKNSARKAAHAGLKNRVGVLALLLRTFSV